MREAGTGAESGGRGMRTAYVSMDPGVPVFGSKGCSVHVMEVIRAMRRAGTEVRLFAARTGGNAPVDLSDVPLHPLPAAPPGDVATRERAALQANDVLRSELQAHAPFDCIYERHALFSFAAMEFAAAEGAAGILEVNAPLVEEQDRYRALADRAAAEAGERRSFIAASAVVAVSPQVADYVRSRGAPSHRVHVIPNGVDPARFHPDVAAAMPTDGGFTIGFAGSMKPWHGLDVLVDAFEVVHHSAPQARLLLVGDGMERQRLADQIEARGLGSAVRMTGAVHPDEMPSMLASMNVAVAPYPADGGFYFSPLKVYEYMAAGLPIVASRIGSLGQLLVHERDALLCPPGDTTAFAASLLRLIRDPVLGRRLGAAARERAVRHHSWDAVVRRIFDHAGLPSGRQLEAAGA